MKLINSHEADLDAFDIDEGRLVIAESDEPGIFQIFLRVGKALVAVIVAVVVCHVDSLHAAVGEDLGVFGRSLEGEGFAIPLRGVGEGSLEIHHSEVVRVKNRFHILEKIGGTVHIIVGVEAGAIVEGLVFSQRAVPGHAYREGHRFGEALSLRLGTGAFRLQRIRLVVGNGGGIAFSGKGPGEQDHQQNENGSPGGT